MGGLIIHGLNPQQNFTDIRKLLHTVAPVRGWSVCRAVLEKADTSFDPVLLRRS